jgi:hypothetical protein
MNRRRADDKDGDEGADESAHLDDDKEIPIAQLTPRERWAITLTIALIVLTVAGFGITYTSHPAFCANCHAMQASYVNWKESAHKNIACNACHARPGATGYISRQLVFLRETAAEATMREPSLEAPVANSSCLRRQCHRDILSRTVKTETIKVRHAEFLQAGANCRECHSSHDNVRPANSSMPKCIVCHNGTIAPSTCATCHIKEVGSPPAKRDLVKLYVQPLTRCSGCHDIDRCTAHHGTEMPHQLGWINIHGKIAGSTNDPYCWRCHEREGYAFCRKCHSAIPPHGNWDHDWKINHKFVVRGQKPSAIRFCNECHDSFFFCTDCHGLEYGEVVYSQIQKR